MLATIIDRLVVSDDLLSQPPPTRKKCPARVGHSLATDEALALRLPAFAPSLFIMKNPMTGSEGITPMMNGGGEG